MTGHESLMDAGEAAVAIVLDTHGRVLLHLRDDFPWIVHPGKWSLPGGQRDDGEDVDTTIRRELAEETSLHVDDPELLFDVVDTTGSRRRLYVYRARTDRDDRDLRLGEGKELRFVPIATALEMDLAPVAREILIRYVS